ncbi:unnamed protein product, partial [Closterium sp. NIES-54]
PGGAESKGAWSGGAKPGGAEPWGAEPAGVEPEGAEREGVELGGDVSAGAEFRCAAPRGTALSGAGAGATGDIEARGAGVTAGVVGTRAAGTGGVGGAGAGDPMEPGAAGAGGTGAGGTGAGGARAGGAGARGSGAVGAGAGGAGAIDLGVGGAGAGGAGGIVAGGTPASPLLAPSPYAEHSGGLTECREPASRSVSLVRTARRIPRSRPRPVLGKNAMEIRPSSVQSDLVRAASPTVSRLLAAVFNDPSFQSTAASALVAELLEFAAACHLDYATALVAESNSASPPSVGEVMDAEMASWKSTGTYVNAIPLSRAIIVDGMWIFWVKRPPRSPPAFKVRYVARGFSQRQGVDYFQTFSPTPKMTTLHVFLHVAAQHDYELHSLDFSTAFLQGSLHEGCGCAAQPASLGRFLQVPSGASGALTLVKSELQKRHTCTDLGELCSYLGLQITQDTARRTITLTQSHMVHQILQRFGFQFSSPQPTPLATGHSLSAPPLDKSVEPSGYCITCATSSMGLVLGGWVPVVLTGHADASWVNDSATQQSSQGYTFSLGSGAEIYAGAMAA